MKYTGLIIACLALSISAFSQTLTEEELSGTFHYRNLGAYRAGCWISDIAVPESTMPKYKNTIYVAARNGGLWKTTNKGTTFHPIFDNYGTNSIGAIDISVSNPDIVWVGTGESYNARSSYYGNGVYKSTDGGEHFENMGLEDSHHISRVIIHPENPDIVYIAAMGHLFSPNEERGVFKTENGGKSWKKVLFISENTGIIDLCLDRSNPETLYAASYEKYRYPWHFEAGGEESGIYKTRDGGENWKKLEGGFPQGKIGRIGIDIHRANTEILYAVVENLNRNPEYQEKKETTFDPFTDHSYDALMGGEVYKSMDAGEHWEKVNDKDTDVSGKAAYSFNQINVDPINPDNVYIVGVSMFYSHDGGKTWPMGWRDRNKFQSNFGDVRTFWIDPSDPKHMMLGSDGGFYISYDGGETMNHLYNIPLGEIYMLEVDMEKPYNIYTGLQDHEIWKGPSNDWSGQIGMEDWVIVGLWDGMHCKVEKENNRYLYFTSQFGKHHREDQWIGERTEITPVAPKGAAPYRYTWNTPIIISPHNNNILYTGGQYLLRSLDRGDHWEQISPDLTSNDAEKIAGKGHIMYCTLTSISESPLKAGILWVGTDDGKVHISKNHGKEWEECTSAINELGVPQERYVSRIVASNHETGRAYLVKSGYRNDDMKPYVLMTNDYGISWKDISSNLPAFPVSVIVEDENNPNLLFIGNDQGVYCSMNQGATWVNFSHNIPPVPVRDLIIHPREKDLIVGTYGRGAFVSNVWPLSFLNEIPAKNQAYLFPIEAKPERNYSQMASWGNYEMTGDNHLRTPNEPNAMEIYFYIPKKQDVQIIISRQDGEKLWEKTVKDAKGLQKVYWSGRFFKQGQYLVKLMVNNKVLVQKAEVTESIKWPVLNSRK